MFCKNCGKKLDEGTKFCPNCGTLVQEFEQKQENRESHENHTHHNKKSGRKATAIIILVVVLVAGFLGYNTVGLAMTKKNLVSDIEKSEIKEYTIDAKELENQYEEFGFTEFSAKKKVLKKLKNVKQDVETYEECKNEIKEMMDSKDDYCLDEISFNDYESKLKKCQKAVKKEKASKAVVLFEDAQEAFETLKKDNDTYIEKRMKTYKELDLSGIDKTGKADYKKYMTKLEKLDGSGDYAAYKKLFAKMDETVAMLLEPEKLLNIAVQQIDASAFPKVKLYMSLKDADTGEVPENLESSLFYIDKKDANAKYVRQVVTNVNQLNEKEALKIDMVADVSGSMNGAPLAQAKEIMSDFVNSVQFSAGDMVELTSFSTGVRLEEEFTSDGNLLINDINGLYTDDMTSLYDALYTAVERVASQTGARCVIAFTDGNDNYSSCSIDDVINISNRYHIPVFIIGIGNIDHSNISRIAQQTGGAYYSVSDVYSMKSIYDEIYRMEKELYLVEYEDNTGSKVTEQADIQVGYKSPEYGGECTYSYVPNTLISVESDALYTSGPEAVVEKYMKAFDDAMTKSDFSYIEKYLLPGSSIYQDQQKYVQKGISEQLDSYEIEKTDYSDSNHCVITTRETYYVQKAGEPLQLLTQRCQYAVEKSGNDWKMTSFAGKVKVLSKIKQ